MVQNKNIELEIVLKLIKGEVHLREIARNINEPPTSVLRRTNKLLKEGIVDYKKEGKNKIFFLKNNLKTKNYIYSSEIYKLSKLIDKHPELAIIIEEIKKVGPKKIILLFGSYAKKTEKKHSDIDIYIETNNKKIKEKINDINSKINTKIGSLDLNSTLIKEIIKNHVIIQGVEDFYEKIKFFK